MAFDTRSSHRLARIPCKVCFRGCVFLLYSYTPVQRGVHVGCILRATLHTMIAIDTLYCILYIFGVLMNAMQFLCCFICVWGVVLPLGCVFTVSCVLSVVSYSIFVDVYFYIHSICMFIRDCMLFGCVELCISPLYVSYFLGWCSGVCIVRFVKEYICCAAILWCFGIDIIWF